MNNYNMKTIWTMFMVFSACFVFVMCSEDDGIENETFDSSELRILKVSEGDRTLENGDVGVSAFGLELEVVLSNAVDQEAFTNAISISNSGEFIASFDETGSIMTMTVSTLEYETEYSLSIPAGSYGADGETLADDYSLTFTTSPFIIPSVTLSSSSSSIGESEAVDLTATLSEITTEDVVVTLLFSGSATVDEDFTVATDITIPAQQQSASVSLSTVDDAEVEGQEAIIVEIAELVNAVEDEGQSLSIGIVDNDLATDLTLKGVMALSWTTSGTNGGKAVHLKATADIPDLSIYGIGVANNGGGTDSVEFAFPAISVSSGDDILLAREDATLSTYFGACASEFEHVIQTDEMNQNGDDAIELFSAGTVIETYGDADVDGTGQEWEYSGSWAYKLGDTWRYAGVDCAASSSTTQDSGCIYPICSTPLFFKGAMEIDTDAGLRIRAYHFEAYRDIADLSIYRVDIFNNGNPPPAFAVVNLPAEAAVEGEDILVVRDEDAGDVGTYFGTCANRFTIYESTEVTSNGDDALVFFENSTAIDTLGVVGVDGSGMSWDYTNAFGYREIAGAEFMFPGADCSNTATSNNDAACFYPFCE